MHKNGADRKIGLPPGGYNLLPGSARDGGYPRHPEAAPAEHGGGMARITFSHRQSLSGLAQFCFWREGANFFLTFKKRGSFAKWVGKEGLSQV